MVTPQDDGAHLFEVFVPQARTVSLAGTFCGWSPEAHPLQPRGDGWWTCRLNLPAGDHAFQYVIDGRDWIADFAAGGVERNGFGCWVSRLWVRPARSAARFVAELDAISDLLGRASERLRAGSTRETLPFPQPDATDDPVPARLVA